MGIDAATAVLQAGLTGCIEEAFVSSMEATVPYTQG
jgi:hypothetical protein